MKYHVDHEFIVSQGQVAEQVLSLKVHLLGQRLASLSWHTDLYPGRLPLLYSDKPEEVESFLRTFKADYEAVLGAQGLAKTVAFLRCGFGTKSLATQISRKFSQLGHFWR